MSVHSDRRWMRPLVGISALAAMVFIVTTWLGTTGCSPAPLKVTVAKRDQLEAWYVKHVKPPIGIRACDTYIKTILCFVHDYPSHIHPSYFHQFTQEYDAWKKLAKTRPVVVDKLCRKELKEWRRDMRHNAKAKPCLKLR